MKYYALCLGNTWKHFTTSNMKKNEKTKTGLKKIVVFFCWFESYWY